MTPELARHPEFFAGVSRFEHTSAGLVPCRFRPENNWAKDAAFMTSCPAGVRLRFHTDSSFVGMRVLLGESPFAFEHGFFSVTVNRAEPVTFDPPAPYVSGQSYTWKLDLPAGEKELEIHLPSYRKVTIQAMEFSDGAVLLPLPSRKRTLFIGDSITQGYAAYPAFSYAARLSRKRNRDFLNLAIGGAQMPLSLPDKLLEEIFDEAVIAFGTNDANRLRKTEDFESALNDTLAFFRKKPGINLIVLSPVYFPNAVNTEKETCLLHYAEILKRTAPEYGAHFVNGGELIPHDSALFFDGCHPTNEGMRHFAENLFRQLQTAGL